MAKKPAKPAKAKKSASKPAAKSPAKKSVSKPAKHPAKKSPAKGDSRRVVKPTAEKKKTAAVKVSKPAKTAEKQKRAASKPVKIQKEKAPAPKIVAADVKPARPVLADAKAAPLNKDAAAKAAPKKRKDELNDFIPNLPVRPTVVKPGEVVEIDRPKSVYIPKTSMEGPKVYVRQIEKKEDNPKQPISKEKMKFPIKAEDLKTGVTIEQKLRALYDLQLIDSRIDKIRAVRGELPLEVQDLEDEIAQLDTRIQNLAKESKDLDTETANKKQAVKDAEGLIKKYREQQNKVRNNREFESLTKEIEFQDLEIQLHKKKMKEIEILKMQKEEASEAASGKMKDRMNDLKVKRSELDEIIRETEKEEKFLLAKSAEAQGLIEERLLHAYQRIRTSSRNGLAVVPIEREASAGSFITIPPQKQMDVAARKKVIVDEHSGRILVDAELAREEEDRIAYLLSEALKNK